MLLWLQEGLHRHTLLLSKHGRGRSSAPQPAAQVYQFSHPDSQIIKELTAPASRRAELLAGGGPPLGWRAWGTCPAPRDGGAVTARPLASRRESKAHVSGTAPGPLLWRADRVHPHGFHGLRLRPTWAPPLTFSVPAIGDRDMGQALPAPGKPQRSHLYTGGRKGTMPCTFLQQQSAANYCTSELLC